MSIDRLNPSKSSGRFYILTLLRIVNEDVTNNYLKNKMKVLDYGCGNTPYKPLFLKKDIEYIGVDIESNKKADLHIRNGKIPLNDNSIDIIISTQVLEHVEFVEEYLEECNRVLKSGGKLLLSTHGHWKYHPDPTDYWRWTKDGLSKIIIERDFEIKKQYGLMGLAASGLQLFQDGIIDLVHARLKGILFRVIAWLQEKIDKRNLNQIDASVFYIVAEKP
ncbi:hypothetical protein GCM10027429_07150 [Marivirga atlantica]|jgi:SAM-dependent methyltransferase|uniref:Class I SAM-dependent methyltransferase n=1 Tax=Marivirga atlantica TaxID=1548457 RepID=A0A937A8S1_9BACT|nr:class I SAM-dependent methyltransferase [Marivirga atlantica]MBL0764325.1 class I SAM-dependent methyltransferase [Marivirga atlantica]